MHLSETVNTGFYFLAPWLVLCACHRTADQCRLRQYFSEKDDRHSGKRGIGCDVRHIRFAGVFIVSQSWAGGQRAFRRMDPHRGSQTRLDLPRRLALDHHDARRFWRGTLIHIYAIGYMHEDVRFKHQEGRFARFFVFLNLFIAAMMILVSGDSYLMLFVGWEGVGLCSFLLIGFWFEMDTLARPSWANSDAAKKAFITNRIGDFGFLIAGFLMFWYLGSFQFDEVFKAAPAIAESAPPGNRGDHTLHAYWRGW
jgi:NADH-quinone oxidoreductase subunit L